VVIALGALLPTPSLATDGGKLEEPTQQAGEDRWVPSLAITSGVTGQKQEGSANSLLFENQSPDPVFLRGFVDGDDIAISPFVGGTLELMSPALPIPTRPRLFASGEILPTFASDRDLALEGDPGCVRGPKPDARCTRIPGEDPFPQSAANGEGSETNAQVDTLVFGASLGVAFPIPIGKRQLRIKPSVGWINYEVEATGLVVQAACGNLPTASCTSGTLREITLSASDSQRFNGIGPGLDVEMDTGRYGPLGVSLFLGWRAYAIVDDRTISFGTEEPYDDHLGRDRATAQFEVKVDPWIFRGHVGIRFHWLGNEE
jgi:hypothetical protein